MHVLILNQPFHPDVAATAQLMWDLARHLRASGHRVSAVASRHVYGSTESHGRAHEAIDGVEIHRVGGTRFGKRHLPGRLADFLSFYAAAFLQMQRMATPDVILALTSPPMISVLGMVRRQFSGGKRVRLVHHVMDLYPDAATAMGVLGRGTPAERVMARLTRRTLETSDAVIALGRDMRELIVRRYRLHRRADRIHVVPPWADGAALAPREKDSVGLAREWGVAGTFTVAYSGNLGMAHDADTIVGAIEAMRDDDAGVRFLFVGGGRRFDALRERAAAAGWPHVIFRPYQDRGRLNDSLNCADVHLVSQLPSFTGIVVPSKLYGIMAVGRPAVMVGPADAECARTIAECGMGYVVPVGDAAGLVRRLRELRDDGALRAEMGRRARDAFEAHYDRRIACAQIERILADAVSTDPRL